MLGSRSKRKTDSFKCLRCGRCCQLDGYVRLRSGEIEKIASHLKMSPAAVRKQYVTTMSWEDGNAEILLDHPDSTECIFLEDGNRCIVHAVKPKQCETFPGKWKRSGANMYCAGLRALREGEN